MEGRISRNKLVRWDRIGSFTYSLEKAQEEKASYEKLKEEEEKMVWDGVFRIIEVTEKVYS